MAISPLPRRPPCADGCTVTCEPVSGGPVGHGLQDAGHTGDGHGGIHAVDFHVFRPGVLEREHAHDAAAALGILKGFHGPAQLVQIDGRTADRKQILGVQQLDGQLRRDHARTAQHVPQGGGRDRGRRQEGFRLFAVVPERHRTSLRIPAHPEGRTHAVEERTGSTCSKRPLICPLRAGLHTEP